MSMTRVQTQMLGAGAVVQKVCYQTGAEAHGATTTPLDDTIPQKTEGTEFLSVAITPKSATNKLKITVVVHGAVSTTANCVYALHQDSASDAIAAVSHTVAGAAYLQTVTFEHYMTAGTIVSTTFKVRIGPSSGTFTLNGASSARLLGGVSASSITIEEIKV